MTSMEPAELTLDELRAERGRLQVEEDAVSFVRRLAQGRVDLVRAERRRRSGPAGDDATVERELSEGLTGILTPQLGGGSARPPRDTEVPAEHPLVIELDRRCDELGFDAMSELDDAALGALEAELTTFEQVCSAQRQELFQQIDTLTAELVRRYRDGAADVDALLED
jgi:hypothetical protein